jgi:RHS repeat-associated protein
VRLSSLSVTNASTSAVLFSSSRGYDAASNVTAVNTTFSAGTDNQAFCYDEQNRLVWAGASGTPSCGGMLTPGSLSSASYTQTFSYDTLDRLTGGPLGSYTYGDSAHLHAVTSIGNGGTNSYTASYDAVGDMTCRAPDTTTTCAGTATGAQLGYDNEGRLASWQNAPSSPTTTDSFLYDGAGTRVEQSVTVNGSITTTTTYVAGGLEQITANGVGTTLTKYFAARELPITERVGTNGPLSYLASDEQGTVAESFDSAGNVTSGQLYTPYGTSRYSSGSSPTTLGYTGQQADSATGLDYYHARYYDPVASQFVSADTVADGLNRYGYVAANPTTYSDPSGHYACYDDPCTRGGGGKGGGDTGGSGSRGGDDTGPHGSCKESAYHPECKAYYDWQRQNGPLRWNALHDLRMQAGAALLGAGAVLLLAGVATIIASRNPVTILDSLLDLGEGAYAGFLGFHLLTDASWDKNYATSDDLNAITFAITALTSAVNSVLGILAAVAKLGWFGQAMEEAALPAATEAVKAAVTGGTLGWVIELIINAAEGFVGVVLTAAAQTAYAAAMAAKSEFNQNLNVDLETWCGQHTGVCTTAPKDTY